MDRMCCTRFEDLYLRFQPSSLCNGDGDNGEYDVVSFHWDLFDRKQSQFKLFTLRSLKINVLKVTYFIVASTKKQHYLSNPEQINCMAHYH